LVRSSALPCILAAAALSLACAGPARAGSFSAITYNVAGLPTSFGGEGELNNVHVSPLLNGYDLVLIQEDFFFHEDLTSAIDYPFVTPKDTSGVTGSGDGLIRMAEHPFDAFQRITWVACFGTLTNASDCLTPKGFSVARHELEPGVFLDVYNLHAEAGGAPEDVAARQAGLRQLVDFAEVFSAGNAVLMGGDWNSRYTDEGDIMQEVVADLSLHDAWVELVRGGVFPERGPRVDDCLLDGRAGPDCEIIDKFLYRGSASLALTPLGYAVPVEAFSDEMGVPLSDHDPVIVTFGFQAVPEPSPALLALAALLARLGLRRR
jgi:hypothetical protein